MTSVSLPLRPESPSIQRAGTCDLALPSWVAALLEVASTADAAASLPAPSVVDPIRICSHRDLALLTIRVARAGSMHADAMRDAARDAYLALAQATSSSPHPHLVRVWNFIPGIHDTMGDGLDRYKVFNQGRYEALARWFGSQSFPRRLPTATGVGCRGDDLIVHALAAASPGTGIENPRQRPAFEYSPRFGPRPPCFARATRATLRGRDLLLVGGTASVRGEESVHPGAARLQIRETLENLAALLAQVRQSLSALSSVRIYIKPGVDPPEIMRELSASLPPRCEVEVVDAAICRQELLVEVEGLAELSAPV